MNPGSLYKIRFGIRSIIFYNSSDCYFGFDDRFQNRIANKSILLFLKEDFLNNKNLIKNGIKIKIYKVIFEDKIGWIAENIKFLFINL